MPAALIFFLARTMRWASVASATRKARAICGVSRPPCSRSVSATLGRAGQRRVTAGEDQPQPVVSHRTHLLRRVFLPVQQRGLGVAIMARGLPAQLVDRAVPGRRSNPRAGVRRQSGDGPAIDSHCESLLDRFLGDVDVAEEADQGGYAPAVLAPVVAFDLIGADRHRARSFSASSWKG